MSDPGITTTKGRAPSGSAASGAKHTGANVLDGVMRGSPLAAVFALGFVFLESSKEQVASDLEVRINMQRIESRVQAVERAETDAKTLRSKNKDAIDVQLHQLNAKFDSLRICVIAPKRCRE